MTFLEHSFLIFITGHTDCSQGPHLHFSLTDLEGKPMSINNKVISGFKIKTGSKPYNADCAEGSCKPSMTKQEVEESCSTIFSKIGEDGIEDDDMRFCPTITANIGIYCTNCLCFWTLIY